MLKPSQLWWWAASWATPWAASLAGMHGKRHIEQKKCRFYHKRSLLLKALAWTNGQLRGSFPVSLSLQWHLQTVTSHSAEDTSWRMPWRKISSSVAKPSLGQCELTSAVIFALHGHLQNMLAWTVYFFPHFLFETENRFFFLLMTEGFSSLECIPSGMPDKLSWKWSWTISLVFLSILSAGELGGARCCFPLWRVQPALRVTLLLEILTLFLQLNLSALFIKLYQYASECSKYEYQLKMSPKTLFFL